MAASVLCQFRPTLCRESQSCRGRANWRSDNPCGTDVLATGWPCKEPPQSEYVGDQHTPDRQAILNCSAGRCICE